MRGIRDGYRSPMSLPEQELLLGFIICAARLIVHALPHVHVTPVLRHTHWFPVRARISYNIVSLCFNAITSSTLLMSLTYICTLLLDLFAPVPTPAYSKFHFISTRRKVIVLSLILDLLSGTHCHCTSEMLQLSTPSSLLLKKKLSLQPPRIWLAHVCLICPVQVCVWCVYVCICACVCGEGGGDGEIVCATDVTVPRYIGVYLCLRETFMQLFLLPRPPFPFMFL